MKQQRLFISRTTYILMRLDDETFSGPRAPEEDQERLLKVTEEAGQEFDEQFVWNSLYAEEHCLELANGELQIVFPAMWYYV